MPQATAVTASAATGRSHRVDRWFYIGAGALVILLSVVGFGPSIIDQSRRNAPVTPLVIAHGIAAGTWLLLFLAQATLAATGRLTVHRRLGRVAPVLAIVMVALGFFMLTDDRPPRGVDLSGDLTRAFTPPGAPPPSAAELATGLLIPLSSFITFGVLVAAGLWYRHRPDIHKRFMLLALTPLAGEPIVHLVGHLAGRWPALQGAAIFLLPVQFVLLFASAIYDKVSQGRVHPVSLWVPILVIAWGIVVNVVVGPSDAWRELAAWLIGRPLG